MEVYLKLRPPRPKHDPAILAAQISQYTKSLGIVATVATSETTPFHLARLISSLDHLSHGGSAGTWSPEAAITQLKTSGTKGQFAPR